VGVGVFKGLKGEKEALQMIDDDACLCLWGR